MPCLYINSYIFTIIRKCTKFRYRDLIMQVWKQYITDIQAQLDVKIIENKKRRMKLKVKLLVLEIISDTDSNE